METTNVYNDSPTPQSEEEEEAVILSRNETVFGPQRVCFDDQGDLTLLIGKGNYRQPFTVCSRTLSRASPVFRAMLYGGFRESKPAAGDDAWVVELPDDQPEAAEPVLSIVHSQFARVPAKIWIRGLFNLLVFTEKYDMTALIRPWVQAWKQHSCCDSDEIPRHYVGKIGVSWELGLETKLDAVGKTLVLECTMDDEGCLVHENWEDTTTNIQWDLPLMPPGFLKNVADARRVLIRLIFRGLRTIISALQSLVKVGDAWINQYCAMKRPHCHAVSLGSIMSELENAELAMLWGMEEAEPEFEYKSSVAHLLGTLKRMIHRAHPIHENGYPRGGHGAECHPVTSLLHRMVYLMSLQRSVLTRQHISRMEAQRAKLGVEWDKLDEGRVLFEPPDGEGDGESAWW